MKNQTLLYPSGSSGGGNHTNLDRILLTSSDDKSGALILKDPLAGFVYTGFLSTNRLIRMNKIYHYTDLNGLQGIVENHCLRATNLYFLNDEEEMHHGIAAFENALNYLNEELSQESIKILRHTLAIHRLNQARHNYNISFCQKSDLLSQWRGYAATQGVCLEFDSDKLESALDYQDYQVLSRGVFYTSRNSTLEAKAEILTFLKEENIIEISKENKLFEYKSASQLVTRLTPFFKHDSFKEESEYRIVIQPNIKAAPVKFRVNQHGLIPYLEVKARQDNAFDGRLPLESVKIGPCKNRAFMKQGIEFLLNYNGYKKTKLSFTDVPFRV
ncbi:DUF2971 domain-containing protein [Serratia marcescens]|uniref:DUF2971 domain-containing protein n=1 Tax=Serratia marcescens TaxID=615 RepID=UPI0020C38D41|nr:DUF2971 domain-containing protein [Serratia marcescens]UTL86305.1 DUF2971 domain-containing protein [Serratia marcescens]